MRRVILAGVWFALFIGAGSVLAQESTPVPTDVVDEPQVPASHESARATMTTFLEAFYTEGGADLDLAASCLDLSHIHETAQAIKGPELAVQLKSVIDRTRYVDLLKIPDDPAASDFVFLRRKEGQVVIARRADGWWLFDSETVSSLDALYRAVEKQEVVEGVEAEAPESVTAAMWIRNQMPESMRRGFFFLEVWQWIGLLLVIVLGVVMERVFSALLQGVLLRFLRRHVEVIDPDLLAKTLRPAAVLLMVLVWGLGLFVLGLPLAVLNLYTRAVWVLGMVAAVVTVYRLVDVLTDIMGKRAARTESRFDDLLVPLIRKSTKVFVVAIGLVFVAQNMDWGVDSLLAGLGLGGLAFALAAQDTVSNLFGSLMVLLDRPFHVGDWVVTGDVEGTVEEVGFRSTRIRTFYNSVITLPNSNLTNAAVDNLGARTYRRWSTRLGLTYDTPPERVDAFCEGVRELIRCHPYTRKDYFHVYFNEFGGGALEVLLYVFFQAPDWATELRERHRLGVDIIRLAREVGVEFAFPTQTLYLRNEQWSAPELAEDGYVQGADRLQEGARQQARRLVDEALHGEVPPPVTMAPVPGQDDGEDEE